MIPFLNLYWKQLAIAGAIIGVFSFGYYKGYSNEKAKFDAFKLELAIKSEAQKQQNDKIVQDQKQITTNVAKEYANAITKLNAYYAAHPNIKWLRDNASAGAMSEVSASTSAAHGEAEISLFDPARANPLDCAADVLQLLYLQQWVKDQANANR